MDLTLAGCHVILVQLGLQEDFMGRRTIKKYHKHREEEEEEGTVYSISYELKLSEMKPENKFGQI